MPQAFSKRACTLLLAPRFPRRSEPEYAELPITEPGDNRKKRPSHGRQTVLDLAELP
jgi:hypothetical protein